ncbi:MAG: hypothetical protein QOH72_2283 [Solirubrobacteraceae bacterium]|jgi:hypothetical protein|nr:hypothetical protein [Solirubrobacteraceae bacterium]
MIVASRRTLRRLRFAAGALRWSVVALTLAGLAASARFLIAPPRPVVRTVAGVHDDHAVEAAAVAFARAYLSLDGQHPDAVRTGLAALTGADAAAQMTADVPPLVRQRVRWADVVSDRVVGAAHTVLVAADTDRRGLIHVAVTVARGRGGALRILGAPALVGGPLLDDADAEPDARRDEVADPALTEVCRRALENYLAGNARNLAADLSATARVSLPDLALRLERMRDLRWTVDGRSVVAAVEAADGDGVRYRLRYAIDVVRVEDRWEIAALATDPTA